MPFCNKSALSPCTAWVGFWRRRLPLLLACGFALQVAGATNAVRGPSFHTGLKAATEAAALDQSLVLLVFGADWCGPCKKLKAETLSSSEFRDQGGPVHIAEVDVDAEETTARAYGITAVPTLVVLTADNKIVARRAGFLRTAELILWLREARDRVKEGRWEGTAPASKLAEVTARAAADRLDTNDLARLVLMLGDPEPAERAGAAKLIAGQREQAVELLIEGVTNSYLGVRISASELLHQLAPDAVKVDPWQAPAELADTASALKKWWAATGRLPAPSPVHEIEPATAGSIQAAIDALRGSDPVRRTEAMSTLVALGEAALVAVREAIQRSEKAGEQPSVVLLEQVRWAILVPDTVEASAGGVRKALARGTGPERQAAAGRLGHAGRAAIPALAELVNDADPLVVESAVRALSGIGGKDALPALAALLKARDSNLRMTAAQALGHTKHAAAVKDLLTVFDDPNEVVACTAISAVEEINAGRGYTPARRTQSPEVTKALKGCLADPRWRVRALAAEVAGKLQAKELIADLKTLLDDPDGFVVKSALGALRQLGASPDPEKIRAVAQRHAGLRGESVELLVKWGTPDAVKTVTEMYSTSATEARLAILGSLGSAEGREQDSTDWQALLERAAREPDTRLRRAAAEALGTQPPKVAATLVGPLLSDEDPATRSAAAGVVLSIISGERAVRASSHSSSYFTMMDEFEPQVSSSRKKSAQTNQPPATAEQISSWHTALQQKAGATPDLLAAAAIYATGQSNQDLPVLQGALEKADKAALARLGQSAGLAAILPRLPWPAGQPVLEKLCASPGLFLRALNYTRKMAPGSGDFLFEPARFRAFADPASLEELETALPQLLSPRQNQWSLLSQEPRTEAVVTALLEATNAAWRAAAIFCLGQREEQKDLAPFERAVKDSNSWVRAMAVHGLVGTAKDRATLEQRLGPLLSDPDKKVAERASIGLLEPETRLAASLEYGANDFEFENIRAWPGFAGRAAEQRPLATLEGKPEFLEQARQRLAGATQDEMAVFALLLAQYSDFSGLDRLLKDLGSEGAKPGEPHAAALAGIALSRDAKYLPYLKRTAALSNEESEFRMVLQALKGMSGPEARELRLEINRRMRQGSE